MQIANSDDSHFIRLFPGKQSDPDPHFLWKTGDDMRFATSSGSNDGSWAEHMRIAGDGRITFGDVHVNNTSSYTFPITRGSDGQVLSMSSTPGQLEWTSPSQGKLIWSICYNGDIYDIW